MAIELLDFQQQAADRLVTVALEYFVGGQDRMGGRPVPFVGQLKAVTGAGKTPILANVIGRLGPSLVLWTTKFGSVVDQTVANLRPGGKYHHLLGSERIDVINFSEITSAAVWQYLLSREDGLTVLVSTVAAWNSAEKDERLNVHQVRADWGERSRWEQLKTERKRKLWVVYDEAHNTTTEQVEQLDDLDPAGFFVASASPLKGKLQLYLTQLPEAVRKERIVPISTRAVVDAQLLKSTISITDYDAPTEQMLADVVARREHLEKELSAAGSTVAPKTIYVVETSGASKGEPRPVAIWRTLVDRCRIAPDAIAVCTNTKDLPGDARRIERLEQLSDDFTHIIFNKKLQEGWDDPSVYVCYFDGKTDSGVRIQQVLGRALRQPGAKHFREEELNTAYFFINTPNEALERITEELKEELRIYKGDEPDDFEPFKIVEERKKPSKVPLKPEWDGKLKVPRLQPELTGNNPLDALVKRRTLDPSDEDRAAPGKAEVNVVSVRTGDITKNTRDLLEDMRVRCGAFLQEQIRALSKNCANSMHPGTFTNGVLDKTACYGSRALTYYQELAVEVVREYEQRVRLGQLADPDHMEYIVGAYQPSGGVERIYNHAAHPHYDVKAFNDDERQMAHALDQFGAFVWVRNKDRLDYSIPLPMKSGSSSNFFPDFLWWVKSTIWALDPTGKFILDEKLRTKLLTVPKPLRIALVTKNRYDANYSFLAEGGWTLARYRDGNPRPQTFESLGELLTQLVDESE